MITMQLEHSVASSSNGNVYIYSDENYYRGR